MIENTVERFNIEKLNLKVEKLDKEISLKILEKHYPKFHKFSFGILDKVTIKIINYERKVPLKQFRETE